MVFTRSEIYEFLENIYGTGRSVIDVLLLMLEESMVVNKTFVHTCILSTDVDEYIVFPQAGTVVGIYSVINQTIATAPETIVFKNGSDALGTITIADSGSGAGDVDSLIPTVNNVFAAGEAMLIEIGGESTNAPQCDIAIEYKLS